jgi:hypothetical protein
MASKWMTWSPDRSNTADAETGAPTKPSRTDSRDGTAARSVVFVIGPLPVFPKSSGDELDDELEHEFIGESADEWQPNLINAAWEKYGTLKQPGRVTAATVKQGRLAQEKQRRSAFPMANTEDAMLDETIAQGKAVEPSAATGELKEARLTGSVVDRSAA